MLDHAAKRQGPDGGGLDLVTDRATEAIAARYGDGPVAAKIQAHIVTAAI